MPREGRDADGDARALTSYAGGREKGGNGGRERRHQAALFYADDGMIASSDPRWLQ